MSIDVMSNEQQVLALAQSLLSIFAGVDQETSERAARAAFTAKGWSPHGLGIDAAADGSGNGASHDVAEFFNRAEKLKPAENVYLCAAFHYSKHGAQAFSVAELREIAGDAGLVLPDRVDMTLTKAGKAGKRYFQATAKGMFKFTSHGELYVQGRWNVKPGKETKIAKGQ
jgi:hypothetical protein